MSRTRPSELDPLVDTFQHDAHRPRAAEALKSLQKIASIVKPIMRQRNWRVGTLCEFFPEEPNLLGLNINRNEKICLRLRYPGDERQFLSLEQVVDTMLHELCHYVHGPHNEQFQALWNQVRDEHEALARKGYTGEGFLSDGHRLGGQRIPMHEAKRRARAAAEQRRQLTAHSGQRVGGAPVMRGVDIRKVIADAAQRRIDVMKGCASGTEQGRKIARDVENKKEGVTTTKAEDDDENERMIMQAYIDLIQEEERERYGDNYIPPSESNPAGMRGAPAAPPSYRSLLEDQVSIERTLQKSSGTSNPAPGPASARSQTEAEAPLVHLAAEPSGEQDTWTCDICTLVNPIQFLTCDACGTERHSEYAESSTPPLPPWPSVNNQRQTTNDDNRALSTALQRRLNAVDSLARIREQELGKRTKPMGWICTFCGNWMETQWWTCASCGNMKTSS